MQKHCPICGKEYEHDYGVGHKCNPRILAAIDAANTRAENDYEVFIEFAQPTFTDKLKDAQEMIRN